MWPETQMAESICNAGAVISLRDLPVRAGFRPPRERVASQRLLVGLAAWLCWLCSWRYWKPRSFVVDLGGL
ncbi:hypothetical protein M430DRAFT_169386 [Amorphotheca resinae ATCC 22711]|uniref:Uncharacterized protein n=1 Tax=Amorphotheca resinae ATCC 22711 TaxID=857342 RepID=A0A2T3AUE9_AMORE|nr:hypothetical protein M430DRAFT_169386 [Amorphotheca resinae ATCC 22711]PSS12309.1 hypothetical protein M430DRAFT_169386 [Amorphotheca resinae ATCC 22711]